MKQFKSLGREFAMGSQSKELFHNHSKEFQLLIKSIGDSKSKSEEDRIVFNQIQTLKTQLTEPNISNRNIKEYIITLLYIEMLGHDASFGYIHAVNITHRDNLKLKRIGYLAVTLFLHDNHDLIILIVNTIQKDLKSDSYVVVCAALNAVCRLINEDTIPAVLPQVVELLGHSKEAVRKKAVMALHRFFQKSPSSVSHLVANFRKRLCDNDPGVMGAALCPLFDLVTVDANSYKDLVVTFVNILKQVVERRLPKNYDYHQMPAPFIQVKLLKILALLGSGDKKASENMYTVLADIIRKSDSSTNIGNAVLYECIRCVASIYPNPMLLEAAADVIANFLKSDNHNLKYMGIDALGRLIKLSLNIAEQHQLAVIDCLEVESYLRILGEPKLPSVFLQVICWVLGEYGTADGKYSASYMSGKLCDIAEAYSNDENVKAYAISALMKIYAFEVAAGRKVDMLPECQSLIEELLASHSTDLQQRAHELQALIGLDAQIVETIMPRDASCIGIEVDKDLSFLNGYVQQSIEKGAQPYIPEDVRTGMENMSSFRSQDQQEPLQHGLRFEAYEIPKPPMQSKVAPVSFAFSTDIASVPKALYSRETHHVSSMGSASEAGSSELKLQLDGVQKKWGKPTYTSSTSSTSYSTSQTPTNGTAKVDDPTAVNSKVRDSYDSRKAHVEISPEKQKLAASLFGGSTKPEKRSSTSHKVPKASASAADRSQGSKTAGVPDELAMERKIHHPPPDLLDLGESTVSTGPPPVDPFQQLEELLDPSISSTTNHNTGAVTNTLDIMTLYAETTASGHSGSGGYSIPVSGDNLDLLYELSNAAIGVASAETIATPLPQSVKFSNAKDSVQKDAFVRQMGVNPSRNLFRDLLG
ncbi:PREDICTED: AP-4 complex subunit epsilon-like isoform X4 [Lupinus angustifolius]|uniref:AP-4 complex subunit epsilon-like isoform X4 n=1 Tax=Lupinus angustifolius TaxID=3871 RepID=UPI00092E6074|nr:PREDICTED: AP-4 complex subunit epsilon-like isoform X4 [Lupinus angustifolius]